MIAPLITITYSIDKIGDGKAQALNAWLKELTYNILIQPFHCVIYLAFYGALHDMLKTDSTGIGPYIFAIVIMSFMRKAEDIIKKIFHFEASSMSSISESGQNFANATGQFAKWGATAGAAVSTFRAAGGMKTAKAAMQNLKENRTATRQLKKYYEESKSGKLGPSNITASSFKEYKNSSEGQSKLGEIKASNAREMATRAEQNRNKRKAKREAKVKDKASTQLREELGDSAYEELKERAASGDASAQKVITDKENKVREGSFPKKAIKGVSKTIGNIPGAVTRFTNSEYGKVAVAAMQDTTRVASAIALGGMALGATGELNDAISLGQLGYGFTSGILQNSNGTVVKESTDYAEKYMEVTGQGMNAQEMNDFYNLIKSEDASGRYKQLPDIEKKIVGEITKLLKGDAEKARALMEEIKLNAVRGEKLDLKGLVEKLNIEDEKDKQAVLNQTSIFSQDYLKAMIASTIKQAESIGSDVDTLSTNVSKKVNIEDVIQENTEEVHEQSEIHLQEEQGASPEKPNRQEEHVHEHTEINNNTVVHKKTEVNNNTEVHEQTQVNNTTIHESQPKAPDAGNKE